MCEGEGLCGDGDGQRLLSPRKAAIVSPVWKDELSFELQTWGLRKGHLPKIPERGVQHYFITTSIELFKLLYKYSATQIFL